MKLGGPIVVIVKPGVGHHPHSLKDPRPRSWSRHPPESVS